MCTYVCACIWVTLGLALPRNLFCFYHPIFLRTIACKCSLIWGTLITWLPTEIPGHAGTELTAYTHRLQPWHSQCPCECKATGKGSLASQTQRTSPALLTGLYLSLSPQGLVSAKGISRLLAICFHVSVLQ